MTPDDTDWIEWTERLRAIAETGRAYSPNPYDQERYAELHSLAQRMQAELLHRSPPDLSDRFELDGGYPTPKVECRAGVFRDGRILMVREESDGHWSLPGGWMDQWCSPAKNAEKEVFEETGLRARVKKLVAVRDHRVHTYRPARLESVYKLLFLCELEGGSLSTSIETTAVDFFDPDDLPPLSIGRILPEDIALVVAHAQDPHLPTSFD
ncbi:MAG: NUDIX hydrolase [Pseudomonadota bacterium]